MGKPVWVVLPKLAWWAWGTRPDGCDWYPSARLFRQANTGDWSAAVARMTVALAEQVAERQAT
jgi:hypothetical protein